MWCRYKATDIKMSKRSSTRKITNCALTSDSKMTISCSSILSALTFRTKWHFNESLEAAIIYVCRVIPIAFLIFICQHSAVAPAIRTSELHPTNRVTNLFAEFYTCYRLLHRSIVCSRPRLVTNRFSVENIFSDANLATSGFLSFLCCILSVSIISNLYASYPAQGASLKCII